MKRLYTVYDIITSPKDKRLEEKEAYYFANSLDDVLDDANYKGVPTTLYEVDASDTCPFITIEGEYFKYAVRVKNLDLKGWTALWVSKEGLKVGDYVRIVKDVPQSRLFKGVLPQRMDDVWSHSGKVCRFEGIDHDLIELTLPSGGYAAIPYIFLEKVDDSPDSWKDVKTGGFYRNCDGTVFYVENVTITSKNILVSLSRLKETGKPQFSVVFNDSKGVLTPVKAELLPLDFSSWEVQKNLTGQLIKHRNSKSMGFIQGFFFFCGEWGMFFNDGYYKAKEVAEFFTLESGVPLALLKEVE